jgi:hypothetical protein
LQNNETARQKSVHDYVVNTLNSSARVYEWTFLHDSDPWQDFSHRDFALHEHTRSRRNSADKFPSK